MVLGGTSERQELPTAPPAASPRLVAGSILNLGAPLPAAAPHPAPVVASRLAAYDASRLSVQEFELLEAFLIRRRDLDGTVRGQVARQIVERIAPNLEVAEEDRRFPEALIEHLASDYRNRRRFR
jgi:hypothetical protein